MKKLIAGMMLVGAGVLMLGSCGEKSRVDELKDLVEEVKQEGGTYTAEQWDEVNEKFSKLLDKLNSYDDLSADELKEIAKLQGEYAASVFKNQSKEVMEKAGAMLDGFINGLSNDSDEENTQAENGTD